MSDYDSVPDDIIETEIEIRVAARTKELESAGRALLEWDRLEQENISRRTLHGYTKYLELKEQLPTIIERFRALLEPITSEDKQEGEK